MLEMFYIVNSVDRPYERLVTQRKGGLLYYIHDDLRDGEYKNYGMEMDRATPIEKFGFDISITNGKIHFIKTRESTATYPDGKPRDWQGLLYFNLKPLEI